MRTLGLIVSIFISNCIGIICGIACIHSADEDVEKTRKKIEQIKQKSMH